MGESGPLPLWDRTYALATKRPVFAFGRAELTIYGYFVFWRRKGKNTKYRRKKSSTLPQADRLVSWGTAYVLVVRRLYGRRYR
jgi:hypothetical protein